MLGLPRGRPLSRKYHWHPKRAVVAAQTCLRVRHGRPSMGDTAPAAAPKSDAPGPAAKSTEHRQGNANEQER